MTLAEIKDKIENEAVITQIKTTTRQCGNEYLIGIRGLLGSVIFIYLSFMQYN